MTFLPDNTLKLEDSYVHPDYRGKGVYKMLFETRMNYINTHLNGYKLIAYCKPTTINFFKKQGFVEKEVITLMQKNQDTQKKGRILDKIKKNNI